MRSFGLLSEQALFRLLVGVVILAPLPLGGNRPWAWSLIGLAVGLLLLLWAVAVRRGGARLVISVERLAWPGIPFLLVLAWAAAQAFLPLPLEWTHPLWAEAQGALPTEVAPRLSIDPSLSATALFRLVAYAGVFWLAAQLSRDRMRARTGLTAMAVAGMAYAAYGLAMHFLGIERILWLEKWSYFGDLTATFVNRNAYGAYAGLGAICATGMVLRAVRRRHQARQGSDWVRDALVDVIVFSMGILMLCAALLFSHSRGAFFSTVLALVVLVALAAVARMIRSKGLAVAVLLACALTGIVGMTGEGTAQRLLDATAPTADEARTYIYRRTLEAIADQPWTGSGLGTFLPTYRMYRDPNLSSPMVWDYAHNLYLEAALDLGLAGAAALVVSVTAILAACLRGLRVRRRDHVYPAVAVAATTLLATHGLVDFSVQMPAIAVTLAFLLGLGYAQAWPSAELS